MGKRNDKPAAGLMGKIPKAPFAGVDDKPVKFSALDDLDDSPKSTEVTPMDSRVERHEKQDNAKPYVPPSEDALGALLGGNGYLEGCAGEWAGGTDERGTYALSFWRYYWASSFGRLAIDVFPRGEDLPKPPELLIARKRAHCEKNKVLYVPIIYDAEEGLENESIFVEVVAASKLVKKKEPK